MPTAITRHLRPAALLLCVYAIGVLHAKPALDQGLRFNSPQVLDLAERMQKFDGTAVAESALAAPETARILAAPAVDPDKPALRFSEDVYGCKADASACSLAHERALVDASHGQVRRDGKHLSVVPASGAALVFADWKMAASKNADGDEETHWYLGRLDGSGYHRVEVQFGQDSPGNFLVNPANGKAAFVHNGSDLVALAPGGMQLVTFNADNPPLSIRVAALDATGPRVQLQCEAGKQAENIQPLFKGWHDAHSLDIALQMRDVAGKPGSATVLRITQSGTGWSVAPSDKAQLDRIGFSCRQAK